MKQFIIFIISVFSFLTTFSQIEIFDDSKYDNVNSTQVKYDSLTNISCMSAGMKVNGRLSITYDHLLDQILLYVGEPTMGNPLLKAGEYYRIDNIHDYCMCTLVNTKTGRSYGNINLGELNSSCVVVGHYEKLKSLYLNKEFLFGNKTEPLISLSGKPYDVIIDKDAIWKCIDIQVRPRKKDDHNFSYYSKQSPIIFIFENETYGKYYCYIERESGWAYYNKDFIHGSIWLTEKSYNDSRVIEAKRTNLIKRFGEEYVDKIMKNEVSVGMTKEMCKESWGEPNSIIFSDSIEDVEQWVYDNHTLYFNDETLTAVRH